MAKSNIISIKSTKTLKPITPNVQIDEAQHTIIYLNPEDETILVQIDGERINLKEWRDSIDDIGYNRGQKHVTYQWLCILFITAVIFIQTIFIIFTYKPGYYKIEDPEKAKNNYKSLESHYTFDLKFLP